MADAKSKLASTTADAPLPQAKPDGEKLLYVLDLTAVRNQDNPDGKRIHEMPIETGGGTIIKPYTFLPAVPLALPPAVAMRFLKHDGFRLTDEKGEPLPFKRRPKQPDELQAGEQLVLSDDETVANYDELSTAALQHRVLEMAGGEKFANAPSRRAMIEFIVGQKVKTKKSNVSRDPDVGADAFVPEAEADDLEDAV